MSYPQSPHVSAPGFPPAHKAARHLTRHAGSRPIDARSTSLAPHHVHLPRACPTPWPRQSRDAGPVTPAPGERGPTTPLAQAERTLSTARERLSLRDRLRAEPQQHAWGWQGATVLQNHACPPVSRRKGELGSSPQTPNRARDILAACGGRNPHEVSPKRHAGCPLLSCGLIVYRRWCCMRLLPTRANCR